MATTTYVQNQIPTKPISSITLKDVCCEYKLSISHLHVSNVLHIMCQRKQKQSWIPKV
jgi:hypothetical protein